MLGSWAEKGANKKYMTVKFGINWIQAFQKNMKSEEKSNLPRNYRVIISNYI